jgi:DNA ligase (NAD+)
MKVAIETRGGKVTGSVSKNTNYLVNNDINSISSKNVKAKQLGIPIITEEQLIAML